MRNEHGPIKSDTFLETFKDFQSEKVDQSHAYCSHQAACKVVHCVEELALVLYLILEVLPLFVL